VEVGNNSEKENYYRLKKFVHHFSKEFEQIFYMILNVTSNQLSLAEFRDE
jgi:hypothetical protein